MKAKVLLDRLVLGGELTGLWGMNGFPERACKGMVHRSDSLIPC